MSWKEEIAYNENVLNGLDLLEPEDREDLNNYIRRAESSVAVSILPDKLKGCLFNFMTEYDVATYLQKRFGVRVMEESRYVIRRIIN